jgi:hypothetical protein
MEDETQRVVFLAGVNLEASGDGSLSGHSGAPQNGISSFISTAVLSDGVTASRRFE